MDKSALLLSSSDQPVTEYDAVLKGNASKKYEQRTVIGDVRNIKRFSWVEWTFLAVGILAFLATLGLTIERFIFFETHFNASSSNTSNTSDDDFARADCNHWTCLSDFTFAVLLITNVVICILYGIDGVLREKGFELMGVLVAIVIILLYLTSNFLYHIIETEKNKQQSFDSHELGVRIARLVIAWIFGPVLAVLSVIIYIRMGRLQFIVIGGNRELMRAYRCSSFLASLIFFNIHALINLLILAYTNNGGFVPRDEKIILPIFFIYVIALSLVGWIGMFYEVYSLMIVFLIFLTPTAAYYIYKIVNVALNFSDYKYPYITGDPYLTRSHTYVAVTLIVVNGLALLIFALIYIFAVLVMRNFGKGLKDKIQPPFYTCYKKILAMMMQRNELQ